MHSDVIQWGKGTNLLGIAKKKKSFDVTRRNMLNIIDSLNRPVLFDVKREKKIEC